MTAAELKPRTPPPGRNAWRDQTIDVIHPEDRGRGHQLPRPHTQQTWRPPDTHTPLGGKGKRVPTTANQNHQKEPRSPWFPPG